MALLVCFRPRLVLSPFSAFEFKNKRNFILRPRAQAQFNGEENEPFYKTALERASLRHRESQSPEKMKLKPGEEEALHSPDSTHSRPLEFSPPSQHQPPLSKNAQKKLLKQQQYEAKKAEKKAVLKEKKKREAEEKRKEREEKLAGATEEEKQMLIDSRKSLMKEKMELRSEEKGKKVQRLTKAKEVGQNVVIDLDFAHFMTSNEINSIVKQIMCCYAANGRSNSPAHLWLTGCQGETQNLLQRLTGFDKWIIEKEDRPYIEAFQDQKERLVYLTADSEATLEVVDPNHIYIVGGLVDRNRWKGLTMKKAKDHGIQTAKLPIGNYLKMCTSQVLTVNQVVEILLKYLETKDWKTSFFDVIPQRKRGEADSGEGDNKIEEEED